MCVCVYVCTCLIGWCATGFKLWRGCVKVNRSSVGVCMFVCVCSVYICECVSSSVSMCMCLCVDKDDTLPKLPALQNSPEGFAGRYHSPLTHTHTHTHAHTHTHTHTRTFTH